MLAPEVINQWVIWIEALGGTLQFIMLILRRVHFQETRILADLGPQFRIVNDVLSDCT